MKLVKIVNSNKSNLSFHAKYCKSFFDKLMGLMFKKFINPDYGIILAETVESKLNSAIHMLFMNFDITVLWLNKDWVIVDKTVAKKWHLVYAPSKPAQYTIELHSTRYNDFSIGDKLILSDEK
jgi:uncharacterized membrane protein (UPF0127 family)